MAANLLDVGNRLLVWIVAGFSAFEAGVQAVISLVEARTAEFVIWLAAAVLMFLAGALIENVKRLRGDYP